MNAILAIVAGLLGFIPPPNYVFEQWAGQIKEAKTLHAKFETLWYDASGANPTILEDEVWIKKPGYFRRTVKSARGRMDYVVTPSRAVRISGGKTEAVPALDAMGPIGLFYLPEGARRLAAVVRQAGIATDSTRLNLQDHRILYEMGQAGQMVIWFGKDDWLPAGAEVSGKQYRLTTNLPSRFPIPFPEWWEARVAQKRTELSRTLSLEINTSISDAVFDINPLKTGTGKP
jgi:outer membrane lipoprotein-sorting protein